MRHRILPVLIASFGALLALIALSAAGAARRAQQIYAELSAVHAAFRQTDRALNGLRSDLFLAGTEVRDFLLDPSADAAPAHRRRLHTLQAAIAERLDELTRLMGPDEQQTIGSLESAIDSYYASMEPAFALAPGVPAPASVRREIVAHRDAALSIARQIGEFNEATYRQERERLELARADFRVYLLRMLAVVLLLGVVVAVLSIYRIVVLQRRAEQRRQETERAGEELRRLSSQLVHAHERERRFLARELHDEVGQTLTALGLELGNLELLRSGPASEFEEHLAQARRLTQDTLRTLRGLAMGLRPSLLDDSGLAPALNWQAREFSRVTGIPVALDIDGAIDRLPETHRTCVYRVVQEALTNCARHAQAKNVRVAVHGQAESLSVAVQDDGVGFAASSARGLGLIGIQERVKELGGAASIQSEPGRGTLLRVEIPVPCEAGS